MYGPFYNQVRKYESFSFITSDTCCVCVGLTAAQSKLNLIHWLDDLVILSANGDHCLVFTTNGIKENGFYQKLGNAQHTAIEGKLSALRQLHTECDTNSISAGKYYAVCPAAGRGQLTIINIELGPFLNPFSLEKP